MKKNNKKLRRNTFFLLFFIILIIISLFIIKDIKEKEYASFQNYEWDFYKDHLENATLRDVEIAHNFSSSKGNIYFEIESFNVKEGNQNIFDLFIPGIIKEYNLSKNGLDILELGELRIYNESLKSQITIRDPSLNKGDIFNIYYRTEEVFPNGKFDVGHDNIYFIGYAPKISLNLGEKYLCESECIKDLYFLKETYTSDYNLIKLELDSTMINPAFHSFKIYSKKDISISISIWTGILISSIFIAFQICMNLFEEIFPIKIKESKKISKI